MNGMNGAGHAPAGLDCSAGTEIEQPSTLGARQNEGVEEQTGGHGGQRASSTDKQTDGETRGMPISR